MDKDIKPQNVRFYCRICLNHFTGCKYDIEDMPRSIFLLFKQCTGYKKNLKTLYPNSICNQCYEIIKNYEELQATSKKSAQFLEELLKPYMNTLKTSPEKSDDSNKFDETEVSFATQDVGQSPLNNDEKIEDPLLWSGDKINTDQEDSKNLPEAVVKIEMRENESSFDMSDKPAIEFFEETKTEHKTKPKKDFTCNICQKTYATSSSLSTHKRLHNTEHSFKCDQCERGFNKRYRLNNHLRQVHGVAPPERPASSKKKYEKKIKSSDSPDDAISDDENKTIATLQNELNSAEGTRPKNEIDIQANLFIQQALNNFKEKDDFSNINKMCKICHKSFSSTAGLRLHMRTHQDTPRFRCEMCGRGFNKKSRFTHHMDEVHAENPIEIVCKYGCGKTFKRSESASGHYRLKHILPAKGQPPKDYTRICEECGKICKNLSVLKEHHYQHVPLEECPYQCGQCKKRFRSKKHMQHHLLRHAGIKKFECPQCGMKKITPHELRVHMNYHTKKIQHYCSVCNKAFTNPGNMRRHEQVVHQGIKKFKCRFCEESFGKAETLKHHEMRHTGERPHKCPHCERCFIQAVALKTHLKTHEKLSSKLPTAGLPLNEAVALLGVSGTSSIGLKVAANSFTNEQNSHSSLNVSSSSVTNLNIAVPSFAHEQNSGSLLDAAGPGTNMRVIVPSFNTMPHNRSLLDASGSGTINIKSTLVNEQNSPALLDVNQSLL